MGWSGSLIGYFALIVYFRLLKSFAAKPASRLWASAKGVDLASLFRKFDPLPDTLDDTADGPKRLETEDGLLGFFILVSICSILLSRCFPDANRR